VVVLAGVVHLQIGLVSTEQQDEPGRKQRGVDGQHF
jgi:hypothetical protein